MKKTKAKFRIIKAWADVGCHGMPFAFEAGPIYSCYGPLLHIWSHRISPELVAVEIRVPRIGLRPKRGKGKR